MITKDEVLMGRDKQYPLTPEMVANLDKLLIALNKIRVIYGKPMYISSGYRPAAINAQVAGAAKKSNHMVCLAADFKDSDRALSKWCLQNLDKLEQCGLWMEAPTSTPTWVHLQCVPPKSGKRVFLP